MCNWLDISRILSPELRIEGYFRIRCYTLYTAVHHFLAQSEQLRALRNSKEYVRAVRVSFDGKMLVCLKTIERRLLVVDAHLRVYIGMPGRIWLRRQHRRAPERNRQCVYLHLLSLEDIGDGTT